MPINANTNTNTNLNNFDAGNSGSEPQTSAQSFVSFLGIKSSTKEPGDGGGIGAKLFAMSPAYREPDREHGLLTPKRAIADAGLALLTGVGAGSQIIPQAMPGADAQRQLQTRMDLQQAAVTRASNISQAMLPSTAPRQMQKRAAEQADLPVSRHASLLQHINHGVEALLRQQQVVSATDKLPLSRLVASAISFSTKNDHSKLALVRAVQSAKGHYGELATEPLSESHQDSIIKHWVAHNVFGQSIERFLERKMIEHGDDPEAKSPFSSTDVRNHLVNRLASLLKPYDADAMAYNWIWSNVVLRELPILRFKDVHHDALSLQDMEWGQKNAGLLFAQNIGHDMTTLSAEQAWTHGKVLLAQLKEGMSPVLNFFRLPSMLYMAQAHPEVMRLRGNRLDTDLEAQAMSAYFEAHDRRLAQENLVLRFENAIGSYRTRGQLAQEIIADRCPGMDVNTYLNLGKTFCRETPHGRPYNDPEYLEDIDEKFEQNVANTAAAFSDLNKPLLLAGWNQLGDAELEFVESAKVRRVNAKFSAVDVLKIVRANPAAQAAMTYGLAKEVELFSAYREGEPERIYAQQKNNGKYQVFRIDREESRYHALLEKELPTSGRQDFKLYCFAIGDPLADYYVPLGPLLDHIANEHQREFAQYLRDYGADKTTLEKVEDIGLSLIPFYTCITSAHAGKEKEAALACTIDALSLIPVIASLTNSSLTVGKVIGTGLLRARLLAANEIALGYSIRQVIKSSSAELMLRTYPELVKVAQSGVRSFALASLRRMDPGIEVGFMLGKKSASRILSLGNRMMEQCSPAMRRGWSKLEAAVAKLPDKTLPKARYVDLSSSGDRLPVIKLDATAAAVGRKPQDIFVKINIDAIEPVGQKYVIKDQQLVPVRIKNILTQGLGGKGAPRKAQQWAQEDQAAARNTLQSPGASRELTTAELHREWVVWTNAVAGEERTLRSAMVQKMTACIDSGNSALVLENCSLRHFPPHFPSGITRLVLSGEQLTELPNQLPPGLSELVVKNSPLNKLPDHLPSRLTHLSALNNQLTALPKSLPCGLLHLFVSGNPLQALPESLPQSLVSLEVYSNQLRHLPEHLPQALKTLNAYGNQLSNLPGELPQGLTSMNLDANQIQSLPENLPQGLLELRIARNRLETLPETLPQDLTLLDVSDNKLAHFGETPFNLRKQARLDLRGNPLSMSAQRILSDLRRRSADFYGPRIDFPVAHRHVDFPGSVVDAYAGTTPEQIELIDRWREWETSSSALNCENRNAAVRRMKRCLLDESISLDLSELNLYALPERLIPNLRFLDLSRNQLMRLPEVLPPRLYSLTVAGNDLNALPQALPASLKKLDLPLNELRALPADLPRGLMFLDASANALAVLPDNLPQSLVTLNLRFNRLTRLPDHLPRDLAYLELRRNQLTQLPENWPAGLVSLDVGHNQLTTLPANLPAWPASINAEANQFSTASIARWQARMNHASYRGPRIHFSMQPAMAQSPVRPLHQAVASWLAPDQVDRVAARWGHIAQDEHAAAEHFARFLDRLADTASARGEAGLKLQVAPWLDRLTDSTPLREQTFAVAYGATASCEDRVICTFNKMQQLLVIHDVEIERYDQHLDQLVTLGREMFRLQQLERIAEKKVKTLTVVDEIEVYLAYQVKLRESLGLTTVAKEMRFYGLSGVSESDLQDASLAVKRLENEDFPAWLAQWEPWQGVIKRIDQAAYHRAMDELNAKVDGGYFNAKVSEALKKENLQGDHDAEVIIGKKIMDEIKKEIYLKLSEEVLRKRQLSNLLDIRWEIAQPSGSGAGPSSLVRQR